MALADHAGATFWYVLPMMFKRGFGFWPALLACCVLTSLLYLLMTWALARTGIRL